MLSELQQKAVWESWLSSEIRANYFADLSYRYQFRQRALTWLTLAFSSGAFATLVTDWLPVEFAWIKAALVFLAAALSLWSLVVQNQKNATDCSDLHFRWNKLAGEFESLWGHMYSEDAAILLEALKEKGAELSKSGTAFPNKARLMEKWQEHVVQHHTADAIA
jgi:fucose 4-O-acetylase-like acetyltransferase